MIRHEDSVKTARMSTPTSCVERDEIKCTSFNDEDFLFEICRVLS